MNLTKYQCNRCGAEVVARVENPKKCGRCNSPYWNKERILKIKFRDKLTEHAPLESAKLEE